MSQSMFHQNKHVFKIHLRKVYLVFTTFIVCLNKFNYTFVYTLFPLWCFSGLLTTRNTLDREGRPNYVLLLFARETSTSRVCINYISSGYWLTMINVPVSSTFTGNNVIWFFQSATATLSISILDINDNNPQFLNNQLYTFSVQEGQSSQVSVGSVTVSYWESYPPFIVLHTIAE